MRSFLAPVFLALLALPVAALAEERGAEERGNAFEARQALARDLANAWQLERAADDVDRLVEMQRTQIAQTMAPTLPVMYEGMYAAIPNAELARYVAWLKTPDAHHVTRTTNRALIEALDRMAEKIGEQFAKNMQATDI